MSLESIMAGPVWAWAAGAAVLGGAIGALVARRFGNRGGATPLVELTEILGISSGGEVHDDAETWQCVLDEAIGLRETASRAQRLKLRTLAIEREFEILRDVLRAMHDGVVVIDRSERIVFANRTAKKLLGLGDQPNPGLDQAQASFEILDGIRSVIGADLARNVKRRKVEWSDGEQERNYIIRCLGGDAPAGQAPETSIIVLEDHTLEERANRAKTEFMYGISHELKTPLTSVTASLEMLAEEEELPEEERDKLIQLSLEEAGRLRRMVQELLDMARLSAGMTEFKFDKVVMEDLLQGLRDTYGPMAERSSISLEWDVSDYVPAMFGDGRLLRQALVNLIGNAIKYTPRNGTVTVAARPEGTDLVLRVKDTGIGIAAEDLPRVFDKFFRAASAEQSAIKGTGLGLPMARYIIERHRGRIEVKSQPDVGTEFIVYLPIDPGDLENDGVESQLMAVDGVME